VTGKIKVNWEIETLLRWLFSGKNMRQCPRRPGEDTEGVFKKTVLFPLGSLVACKLEKVSGKRGKGKRSPRELMG